MSEEQRKRLAEISNQEEQITQEWFEYWKTFSTWDDWHFWAIAIMLVIPLIVVFFAIDKRKVFQIGFYGFNIHVWFAYSDALAMVTGHVAYPFQVIPVMPVNFALDVSLVPVSFMLLYQWCLNHNKNVFLYGALLSAIFSFLFKPLLVVLDLIQLHKGMGYIDLFWNYLLIVVLAMFVTRVFLYLQQKGMEE